MSEEVVSGCIQHKDTRHVRLYNDYMDIYKGNEHKAKIIRVLETWTDSKRAEWYKTNSDRIERGEPGFKQEPDFWITMSYGQFKQFMYGSISEETLKKNLTELEKAKHITRRVHPEFPYGPPQYLLNTRVIQGALNKRVAPSLVPELPQGDYLPPPEITPTQGVRLPPPQGYNYPYPGGNVTPTLGAKTGTSNNTTKNYSESGNDNERETDDARAQFDENDYHFYGTKQQHLIWNCHNWCAAEHGTCEGYVAAIEAGWQDDMETAPKIEAVKPPVAQTLSSLSDVDGAASGGKVTGLRASDEQPTPVSLTAGSASPPATQMPAGAVTQASILADWEAIQGQPQAWTDRHYKAARQGVRASPTREELAGCRAWLPTTDNPKTLWYHSHGVELWDVIEKLNAYRSHLALSIEPAPLADMPKPKPMDIYTEAFLDQSRTERNLEKLRQRRLAREAAQQQGGTS